MSRAKVGDWVATFGKVVALHGRSQLVIRIEGSEITVNRSECWNPDDDAKQAKNDMVHEIFKHVLPERKP
jgi:hypothetical protein